MRKFKLSDVFLASKVFKKIDLKNCEVDLKKSEQEIGMEIVYFLFTNLDKAEEEITNLFNALFETENALNLEIDYIIKELTEGGDFVNFLQKAQKLTK